MPISDKKSRDEPRYCEIQYFINEASENEWNFKLPEISVTCQCTYFLIDASLVR